MSPEGKAPKGPGRKAGIGKALEFLVDHATVVDEEGNEIDLTISDETPEVEDSDERTQQDEQEEEAADA